MTTKIILIITLIAYAIIVSQPFMYILSLKDVQLHLDVNTYTEVRKLTDISMRASFKYVIYAALIANILLIIATVKTPGSIGFITAVIAFVALLAEVLLTLKGSLPVNDIINTWTANNYPSNWTEIREQWFSIFQYRQIATILGFISLVAGSIFGSR